VGIRAREIALARSAAFAVAPELAMELNDTIMPTAVARRQSTDNTRQTTPDQISLPCARVLGGTVGAAMLEAYGFSVMAERTSYW
jgi:hypothetical protein